MTNEPPRPLPQSTVQLAGQAATDVIGGLRQHPALLAVVVLNLLAICAAVWFMAKIITVSQENMRSLMAVCFPGETRRQDYGPPPSRGDQR